MPECGPPRECVGHPVPMWVIPSKCGSSDESAGQCAPVAYDDSKIKRTETKKSENEPNSKIPFTEAARPVPVWAPDRKSRPMPQAAWSNRTGVNQSSFR